MKIEKHITSEKKLQEVEKKARVRTFGSLEAVEASMVDILADFSRRYGMSYKALEGAAVQVCAYNGGTFPNAYKGRPEATFARATLRGGRLVDLDIWRGDCNEARTEYISIPTPADRLTLCI